MIIILLSIFFAYLLIKYFSKKISPFFLSYANTEVRKITTLVITRAVNKQIISKLDTDSLYETTTNDSGEIMLINFNSDKVMEILSSITDLVWLNLKAIEEGNIEFLNLPDNFNQEQLSKGIIYEIPFGIIFDTPLLNNMGPRIPVKMYFLGDVVSNINTSVTEYGINNALLKVSVNIEIVAGINLPFVSEKIKIITNLPLDIKVIQGKVPNYFYDRFNSFANE